ncbi:GIY-YIG nuclease family protein [Muricauda sp. JGD-17]|uniref:GIY-YIG nuclease family protein n=1 Tax=Flagellimonas ochracea TaxID=2696472 RepID=A0A964WXE9_9FLAO|nr:GIY-YIG nuclease family protein [Allomuricauda ochracea]NAY91792.1 GIY-YIG nuclease family protein [Allomuricauda ochracea]
MDFFVYIIFSESVNRYYVGHCGSLEDRIQRHRTRRSKYTKIAGDWELKWTKVFPSRGEAMAMEREIKKKKSRKYLEYLIARDSGG